MTLTKNQLEYGDVGSEKTVNKFIGDVAER